FFGAGVVGAAPFLAPDAGALPGIGFGAAAFGLAGVKPGTVGFAPPVTGAGALAGGGVNVWSRTDFVARPRVDASASRNDKPRNNPPHHQLALVRRFPA